MEERTEQHSKCLKYDRVLPLLYYHRQWVLAHTYWIHWKMPITQRNLFIGCLSDVVHFVIRITGEECDM